MKFSSSVILAAVALGASEVAAQDGRTGVIEYLLYPFPGCDSNPSNDGLAQSFALGVPDESSALRGGDLGFPEGFDPVASVMLINTAGTGCSTTVGFSGLSFQDFHQNPSVGFCNDRLFDNGQFFNFDKASIKCNSEVQPEIF
jgi:hypothetical protein